MKLIQTSLAIGRGALLINGLTWRIEAFGHAIFYATLWMDGSGVPQKFLFRWRGKLVETRTRLGTILFAARTLMRSVGRNDGHFYSQ